MAYIKEIRDLVGHRPLIMTSASGALLDQQGAVLLQNAQILVIGASQAAIWNLANLLSKL